METNKTDTGSYNGGIIQNKPAPSRWINVYRGKPDESYLQQAYISWHVSDKSALEGKSFPQDYLGTFEVKSED